MLPTISLVASAIRTERWSDFCNSLKSNKITSEVIFVGCKPPVNQEFIGGSLIHFKYIPSWACPAKCYEIGFREAQGDLIHWTADDAIYAEGALDRICEFYGSFQNTKLAVGFFCIENGSLTSDGHTIGIKGTPRMLPFGVVSKSYMKQLGGYDRRFITGQAENDLIMRIYEAGGRVELCRDAIVYVEHNKAHDENTIMRTQYQASRGFLEKCWFLPNGEISNKRLIPFEPFKL